jgi:hypothetical protein
MTVVDVYPASRIKPLGPILDRVKAMMREASEEDVARLRDWFMGAE